MLINIDRKTNLLVDIGDKKPTQELIEKLRKKLCVGRMFSSVDNPPFGEKTESSFYDKINGESE